MLDGAISEVAALPTGVNVGAAAVSHTDTLVFAETGASGPNLATLGVSGKVTQTPLPSTDAAGTFGGVTTDASGNVWYSVALGQTGKVGEVSPSGTVTEYNLPSSQDVPGSMTYGAGGSVWVAVGNPTSGASIARVNADGTMNEFPVAGATSLTWLTAGQDGNLWFVDGQKIGKMTPSGAVQEFTLPAPSDGSSIDLSNAQLTQGGDGNLWFIGLGGISRIGADGTVKTFSTPGTKISSLGAGSDGNLWFTFAPPASGPLAGTTGTVIARMTPDGITTLLTERVDSAGTAVSALMGSPEADLWVVEAGGVISRISLNGVPSYHPAFVTADFQGPTNTDANGTVIGTVASFVPNYLGATASDFTATINWGDNTPPTPATLAENANGGYDVSSKHTYTSGGGTTAQIAVSVTGPNSQQATIYSNVAVASTVAGTWLGYPAAGSTATTTTTATTPVASGSSGSVTSTTPAKTPVTAPTGSNLATVPLTPASGLTGKTGTVTAPTGIAIQTGVNTRATPGMTANGPSLRLIAMQYARATRAQQRAQALQAREAARAARHGQK